MPAPPQFPDAGPDFKTLIFINETSKDERTWACHYGCSMAGQHAGLADVFVCGDCYSLVAAMSVDGYLVAEVVEVSYDHDLFYQFITQQVVSGIISVIFAIAYHVSIVASIDESLSC